MKIILNKNFATAIFIFIIISSQILAQNLQEELNEPITQYKSGDTINLFCHEYTISTGANNASDCWGWIDGTGVEYAIYATSNSVKFYNVETGSFTASMLVAYSAWHDIKTYQHYCYVVSEGTGKNEGLSIIDMQYLPDSLHLIKRIPVSDEEDYTSHNLSIDTVQGYLYCQGDYVTEKTVSIFSLADPEDPLFIRSFGPGGSSIHDIFCHNDTLYVAEGYSQYFSIWDMARKQLPQLITRVTIPSAGYIHNIWPTGDKRHVLTTEETPGKTVKLWNIEDVNNVQLMDEYLAPSGLAHNAHIVGDTAYISHYESGVVVLDLSNPNSIVELYKYDTYPESEIGAYNGCWGVYPHTPTGRFYASDMEGDLTIIKNYNQVLADTLIALDAQEDLNSTIQIDIWANFTLPIHEFEIPFNWDGPFNLTFDSVSTSGLITEYFEVQQLTAFSAIDNRGAYLLRASQNSTSPDLPAGEGVIMSIFFTVPYGASGEINQFNFNSFNGKETIFKSRCVDYTPDTLNAVLTLDETPCCVGIRGNVDGSSENPPNVNGIDISDLILLIDIMFRDGLPPQCPEEADINGSGGVTPIDISDLIALVGFMFKDGAPPADCF